MEMLKHDWPDFDENDFAGSMPSKEEKKKKAAAAAKEDEDADEGEHN